ncbi:MAG: hypothetical protein IJ100_06675 [Lachnospiraceae bacterium]|nr:hypothetical protein [Lachnospiraceae bacterium]
MNKYELKITVEEIDSLIGRRRYKEAAEVADSVDWRRVKNVRTLCRVSDVYKINKRYDDSKRILELAYVKDPYARQIIFSMCELELKLGNYVRALQLYNEYINVAPRDADRFVLQYKLYKAQNVSINERIAVLEELARHDMRERWAYDLARLYLEAGERNLCASQCDEIIAFFGGGRYVQKALELKASFTELTVKQKALYRKMTGEEEEEEPVPTAQNSVSTEPNEAEEVSSDPESESVAAEEAPAQSGTHTDSASTEPNEAEEGTETQAAGGADPENTESHEQHELAEETQRTGGQTEADAAQDTDSSERIPDLNQVPSADEIPWEYEDYEIQARELKKKPARKKSGANRDTDSREPFMARKSQEVPKAAPDHSVFEDHTFEISPAEDAMFSQENMQKMLAKGLRDLENYDTYLRQETDGQYAMVIQEETRPDKQITGQLNLEEIMSEWEKVKRDFYESNGLEDDAPQKPAQRTTKKNKKQDTGSMYTKSWDRGEVHKALQIKDDDSGSAGFDTSLFVTEGGGEFPGEFVVEKMTINNPEQAGRGSSQMYLHSEDSIRQLTDALGRIFLEGGTGNVVITGDEGAGTLSLARELVRRYRQINPNFVGQIAKSEGRYITRENMLRVIPRMPFGALIIERASMMSEEGAAALCELLKVPERSILIIMIDRKGVMDAFLNDHPRMRDMFPARVDIAALSVDTLLGYAREYAGKQQCEIDEYGINALQSRILSSQTVNHSVTLEDIRDIVDEAIYYASRKSLSSLVDSFSRRKSGTSNRIILRDKDFLHY